MQRHLPAQNVVLELQGEQTWFAQFPKNSNKIKSMRECILRKRSRQNYSRERELAQFLPSSHLFLFPKFELGQLALVEVSHSDNMLLVVEDCVELEVSVTE